METPKALRRASRLVVIEPSQFADTFDAVDCSATTPATIPACESLGVGADSFVVVEKPKTELNGASIPAVATSNEICDDLAELPNLTNDAALAMLKTRWLAGQPYTHAHASVVVAVNPYSRRRFGVGGCDATATAEAIPPSPPELLAARAVARYLETGRAQTLVVSGESGAGKTETTKAMLEHLGRKNSEALRRVVACNPMLESFGNARTAHNDNSSRFVKLVVLGGFASSSPECTSEDCLPPQPATVATRTMLFEKSRVIAARSGETNFHAFYQLLAGLRRDRTGAAQWLGLVGASAEDFRVLRGGANGGGDGNNRRRDLHAANETLHAMSDAGLSSSERNGVLRTLAAVLHLTELDFEPESGRLDESSRARAQRHVARLLGVSLDALEKALCERRVSVGARGETIVAGSSHARSEALRDALAKELYSRCFAFLCEIVDRPNETTIAAQCKTTASTRAGSDDGWANNGVPRGVAFLDIMGFEASASSEGGSFERLLVNYANERLHQMFVKVAVGDVLGTYAQEGVEFVAGVALPPLASLESDALALFEDTRHGLLALLDDENRLGSTNDASWVNKAVRASMTRDHSGHGHSVLSVVDRGSRSTAFRIAHYAGSVTYDAHGFLEKNIDATYPDILDLADISTTPRPSSWSLASSISNGNSNRRGSRLACTSLGARYKTELARLVRLVEDSDASFVKCLRPNREKSPGLFQDELIRVQLAASGVVAAVAVARGSYQCRMPRPEFERRFARLDIESVFRASALPHATVPQHFARGKRTVFLGARELDALESELGRLLHRSAVTLQRFSRVVVIPKVHHRRAGRDIAAKRAQRWIRCVWTKRMAATAAADLRKQEEEAAIARNLLESVQLCVAVPGDHLPEDVSALAMVGTGLAAPPLSDVSNNVRQVGRAATVIQRRWRVWSLASRVARLERAVLERDRRIRELETEVGRLRLGDNETNSESTADDSSALRERLRGLSRIIAQDPSVAAVTRAPETRGDATLGVLELLLDPGRRGRRGRGLGGAVVTPFDSPIEVIRDWALERLEQESFASGLSPLVKSGCRFVQDSVPDQSRLQTDASPRANQTRVSRWLSTVDLGDDVE